MDEQKFTKNPKLNELSVALVDAFREEDPRESTKNGMKVNAFDFRSCGLV